MSNLIYDGQSGAINESLSDTFGEYIDLTNTGGTDNPAARWLLVRTSPAPGLSEIWRILPRSVIPTGWAARSTTGESETTAACTPTAGRKQVRLPAGRRRKLQRPNRHRRRPCQSATDHLLGGKSADREQRLRDVRTSIAGVMRVPCRQRRNHAGRLRTGGAGRTGRRDHSHAHCPRGPDHACGSARNQANHLGVGNSARRQVGDQRLCGAVLQRWWILLGNLSDGVSTTTAATVTGLTNGIGYRFRVAAVNAIGTSAFSPPSTEVTPERPSPAAMLRATSAHPSLSPTPTPPALRSPSPYRWESVRSRRSQRPWNRIDMTYDRDLGISRSAPRDRSRIVEQQRR